MLSFEPTWLRPKSKLLTRTNDGLKRTGKTPPRSLVYTALVLLLSSVIMSVGLIGCGNKQVVTQRREPLTPPPGFLMQNPPTADLIPPHLRGKSAKSEPNSDASKETAPKQP